MGSGVFIEPLWRDTDFLGVGEVFILSAEGSADDGGDGVPARFGAAGYIWGEEDWLIEGNVAIDHSVPLEPPICPFPLGDEEKA